jgi:glycosyltransferase involved in cell wall biosynthesis
MISIIIPTYNCEKYIGQAVQSLLAQTYKNFEIIVVDDGSTDETKAILEPYMDKIRYVFQINGGESSARNRGLSMAKGNYIAFLDADDIYKPNKLEQQLNVFLKDSSVDIVYNDVEVVDENLQYTSTLNSEYMYEAKEDFLCMLLVRQIIPGPASIMLRKKCIDSGIRYPEQYRNAEDYQFIINLASHYRFKYLKECLYIYRRHSKNLTNNHSMQLKSEIAIVKDLGIEKIQNIVYSSNFSLEEKKFILARIWMKIQEWDKAKKILINLVDNCMNPYAWFYLGNCYYKESNLEYAISVYEKAICEAADMAEAYNNLGCMYGLLKQADKAKILFEQALAIRKEYMDAKYNFEQILSSNSNYKITIRT